MWRGEEEEEGGERYLLRVAAPDAFASAAASSAGREGGGARSLGRRRRRRGTLARVARGEACSVVRSHSPRSEQRQSRVGAGNCRPVEWGFRFFVD